MDDRFDVEEINPEDRQYRDAVAKVEPYGVDHIPDAERHGKPSSQFTVWFAGNLGLGLVIMGFYSTFYGLAIWQGVLAVVAGTALGAVLMGVLSAMGTHLGLPQQIQARGPLGYYGNFLPVAFVNVFAGIGWAAFNIAFATILFKEIVDIPFWIIALVISVIMGILAIYGYNMIHYVNRWSTVVLGALFLVFTILALRKATWSAPVNEQADYFVGVRGGWIILAGFFLAYLLAWAPFASDYSRYLPKETPGRKVGFYTALGNFVIVAWLGILGVLVGSFAGAFGPGEAVRELTGGFAVIALLTMVLAAFPPNCLNIYGAAISILTLRIPLRRDVAAALVTVVSFGVALFLENNLYGKFYQFVVLSGYLIAPYVLVVMLDYYLAGRRDLARIPELYDRSRIVEWGFVPWALGCAASVPFWVWSQYVGPFATAYPNWGDLSYYVGGLVAVIVYLLVYRLRPLSEMVGWSRPVRAAEVEVAESAVE